MNGQSMAHDLFALTDEQILEIEPEGEPSGPAPAVIPSEARNLSSSASDQVAQSKRDSSSPAAPRNDRTEQSASDAAATSHESPVTSHHATEPPAWVAEAMNDPQRGREARAFWEGSQKTQQEAAAYREVFAKPEEARAAAERARVLEEIDRAYFGATGNSAEQTSAARAQLAQMMLRENPAAFREMVFAGLRALEETGKSGVGKSVAQAFRPEGASSAEAFATADRKGLTPPDRVPERSGAGGTSSGVSYSAAGTSPAPAASDVSGRYESQFAAYAAFEKAANEELEKSVGGAIERTIERALPVAQPLLAVRGNGETQARVPALHDRLSAAVRQDIEAALKGDRQLSEQIAQILSARRFDGDTRAQVVRLIDERAKQLVPGAAKRVLQDWTQTTLATHRSRTRQNDTTAARSDLAPANSDATSSRLQAGDTSRPSARNDIRGGKGAKVDYRKLSDEQILNL
jgi:hypothetical protein